MTALLVTTAFAHSLTDKSTTWWGGYKWLLYMLYNRSANVRSTDVNVESKKKTKIKPKTQPSGHRFHPFLNNLHMIFIQECITAQTGTHFKVFRPKLTLQSLNIYKSFSSRWSVSPPTDHILKVTHTHSEWILRSSRLRKKLLFQRGSKTALVMFSGPRPSSNKGPSQRILERFRFLFCLLRFD